MENKRIIHVNERYLMKNADMDESLQAMLKELKMKLTEQDMVKSLLSDTSNLSTDVYRIIRADYQKVFAALDDVKQRISMVVMGLYEPEKGSLAWNFTSMDGSLTIYVNA